ncbi:hypothetical protein DICPUDRAFT_92081 [Dictyostelium purpureum]|uniref:O-methyltransferase C-terminal domain-containing protein n=1 Tax=Dictyostelium purpureum TaxID=5786 RepID=F0ZLR8_DICPU|nr:uncharacterized protein DICPUDRAFT_92081 [Dictyostelium purpureum]EGC35118.1 hypothetical protein DICPUDRAFT_92081 [Dictyostelium purpureum]|eukprot:XP_003288370.1 hypothetical protein DICPUDRAFT_92081 [Dictyostelium purpureum]
MLENNRNSFDIAYPFFGGYLHTKLFSIIMKHDICDMLETEENGLHYKEISKITKINENSIYRVMRYFIPFKLFTEKENGVFCKTEISTMFSGTFKALAKRYSNDYNYKLYDNIEESIMKNVNMGPEALGVEKYWDSFQKYPEYCKLYMDSMKSYSKLQIENILQNVDFSPYKSIADIGGSHGLLIKEILDNYQSIAGINFDLKCVLDKSPLKETPRLSLVNGSFFDQVPKANCFILKNILHDWDDEHCIKILQTVIKSMDQDSKIMIIDYIIEPKQYKTQQLFTDIIMLHCYNGKERTKEDWDQLFEKANLKRDKIISNVEAGCQILSLK